MSRKFTASMPEHPEGYDKRMTREIPRDASDNSAYEERIYQDSAKLAGTFTGTPKDTNLLGRVKDVRTVAQTVGHEVKDYPGENTWFIKAVLTDTADQNRCITLTLASGKNFKAVASPDGAYYNSLEYCNDGLTWNALPLNTDITPYEDTSAGIGGIVINNHGQESTFVRNSSADTVRPAFITLENENGDVWNAFRDTELDVEVTIESVKHQMKGWWDGYDSYYTKDTEEPSSEDHPWYPNGETWTEDTDTTITSYITPIDVYAWSNEDMGEVYTETLSIIPTDPASGVEGTHAWATDDGYWMDLYTMMAFITSTVGPSVIWLRGRILHKGGVCPKFSGNADAITKVEGDLSSLLDYRATSVVAPNSGTLGHIFQGCTALTDASGLALPTGNPRGSHPYWYMFENCTALTSAPNLSNVPVVVNSTFYGMFKGCTALTTAPALPRPEVLTAHSYREMFYGCTHLSSVTVYIGSHIKDYGLLNWMYNAGTAVNGQCTFNHAGNFRWRYPSKSGIPGASADNQKEWTPVPALTTKLYFSTQFGGTVSAQVGTATIASGDSVIYNQGVTVTPTPSTGYIFDSWVKKPAGATVGEGGVLTFNMPYGRYEDGEDKVECVASFVVGGNLLVNYSISGTFSEIAYVRTPADDKIDSAGAPASHMYAWNSVDIDVIGGIYTPTLQITKDTALYAQNDDESWYSSSATIADGITTTKYTVAVFDRVTTTAHSVKVKHPDGTEYENFVKEFCISIANVNDEIVVTGPEEGCIGWSQGFFGYSGRTVTLPVTAMYRGLCLERLDYYKQDLALTATETQDLWSVDLSSDTTLQAIFSADPKKSRLAAHLKGTYGTSNQFDEKVVFTWDASLGRYRCGDFWGLTKVDNVITLYLHRSI